MLRAALIITVLLAPMAAALASSPTADDEAPTPFFVKESLAWRHERSHQLVEGLRVLDAGSSRHVALDGSGLAVAQERLAPDEPRRGAHALAPEQALRAALAAVPPEAAVGAHADAPEAVWLWKGDALQAGFEVRVHSADGGHVVVLDGASGAPLRVEPASLRAADAAPGRVFRVNPVVALQDPSFRDNRLSVDDGSFAEAFMDVEIANVTGPFFESERVAIVDALTLPPSTDAYSFDRADPRFLETMVYHYVELALTEVAAVGHGEMLDAQVVARAHHPVFQNGVFVSPAVYPDAYAGNGQITFIYRALTPGGPGFGSGAEDAEIIVHELGHLLHFAAAPDAAGDWRYIWGEGNGDFLAAVVLEPVSGAYGDPCISEWLATYYEGVIELFPYEDLACIRVLDNDLRMPDDFFGDLTYQWSHENGQFWSGALWDIRQEIGREESLRLFLESLYFMPAKAEGFEDMGVTLLLADLGLTGGAREDVILRAFADKGIVLPTLDDLAAKGVVQLAAAEPDADAREDGAAVPGAPLALLLLGAVAAAAVTRRAKT